MKKSLFLLGLGLFWAGCNYTGTPVEYANTCNKENDDKRVEIVGFFNNSGSAMCSKSGNEPMRCPIDFIDAVGSTKIPIRAYIDKGSGASSIDAEKDKPLKITDEKKETVENSQKVKIVADVNVFDTPPTDGKMAGCYLTVKKIEKHSESGKVKRWKSEKVGLYLKRNFKLFHFSTLKLYAMRLGENDLAIHYHDSEWGVPLHDDRALFEFLILEGAQAGLSWDTVLAKRENYRKAFDNFDAEKIALYDEKKCAELLQNQGIIRNRLKIASAVRNAKCYLKVCEEFGTFDSYIWSFVDGKPIKNAWENLSQVPASTAVSDAMSKDLKRRGFNFVGSTIMYAFMQATGMVNDHLVSCFRYDEV